MKAQENAYAVLLAGGGGTRLWPKSRKSHPKHLLKLFGKETLLRITYNRISPVIPVEKILVVTLLEHKEMVEKELPELPKENIIVEPEQKNTALAMGVAAAFVKKRDPNGVIINLAADHIYKNEERFRDTAIAALDVATNYDYIVSIGIKPTFPHTGLGYIRSGKQLGQVRVLGKDLFAFQTLGFKEKPDLPTAQAFLATGQYLWNANLYTWSVNTIFEAFKKYSPDLYQRMEKIYEGSDLKDQYEGAESLPIDVAVSEKADNLVVIPGDFGWSDIGDWKVVYDSLDKDESGNAVVSQNGMSLDIGSRDCLIETDGRLVVTIGLQDLVVIDTGDAILICPKDKTQDVKKAVEKLKEDGRKDYL